MWDIFIRLGLSLLPSSWLPLRLIHTMGQNTGHWSRHFRPNIKVDLSMTILRRGQNIHTGRSDFGQVYEMTPWAIQGGNFNQCPKPLRLLLLPFPMTAGVASATRKPKTALLGGGWCPRGILLAFLGVFAQFWSNVWNSPSLHLNTNMSWFHISFSQFLTKCFQSKRFHIRTVWHECIYQIVLLSENWLRPDQSPDGVLTASTPCPDRVLPHSVNQPFKWYTGLSSQLFALTF